MHSRIKLWSLLSVIIVTVMLIGLLGSSCALESAKASSGTFPVTENNLKSLEISNEVVTPDLYSEMAYFAKYEGIDGEVIDEIFDNWIEIMSIEWGAEKPTGMTGSSRRRGAAIVDDFVITFLYEKAAPKLEEKCLKGAVIPKLQIELTSMFNETRKTYLKYELENVMISSFDIIGIAESGVYPKVTIANNFESIKVTYTEYDALGMSKGNIEYSYDVETGE